jgi:hypothetical protein
VVIASPAVLLVAALLASPAIASCAKGETPIGDAALRYLICVPVAAIMLAILRALTRDYGSGPEPIIAHMLRRRTDPRPDTPIEGDAPVQPREPSP